MAVLGVDGWRGRWAGTLLEGRSVRLLVLDDVPAVLARPLDVARALADLPEAVDVLVRTGALDRRDAEAVGGLSGGACDDGPRRDPEPGVADGAAGGKPQARDQGPWLL